MEGLVVGTLVADQKLDRGAQIRLVAEDDAERTEGSEPAERHHAKREVGVAGLLGRQFEEASHPGGEDPPVRDVEVGGVEPHGVQQPGGIEPERTGETGVAGQRSGSDARSH